MKTKNLVILGAIGLALYYLLKKDKPSTVGGTDSTTDEGDVPRKPFKPKISQPYSKFSDSDLRRKDRTITITEDVGNKKRMSRQLIYNPPYMGGARPTEFVERTSNAWQVIGNFENLPTKKVCMSREMGDMMPFGMPFDDPRNCKMIAKTEDVISWIFSIGNGSKWDIKYGKSRGGFLGGKLPEMSKPQGKGMPIPMGRN